MASEAGTITLDVVIEMLEQVLAESGARDWGQAAAWRSETLLEEAGISSYDFVELIFKLEDRFGLEIDYNANDGINDVRTIGELRDAIDRLLAKNQAA